MDEQNRTNAGYSEENQIDIQTEADGTITLNEAQSAGFWLRLWAYIVDVIVVFSVNGILLSPLLFMNNGSTVEIGFWTLNAILSGVVYYVYFLLMTKFLGQTLGKMIFGLKVVGENNEPLKWTDLFFREVIGRFLHNVFFILKLLYLVVAFTKEKQGIHDMIGNTKVIHV